MLLKSCYELSKAIIFSLKGMIGQIIRKVYLKEGVSKLAEKNDSANINQNISNLLIKKNENHVVISINEIIVDKDIHIRTIVNPEIIDEYTISLNNGELFPPIKVYKNNENKYLLVDGLYRLEANKQVGNQSIECIVLDGSYKEVLIESIKYNKNHGLRMSNQDKEKTIKIILNNSELSNLSDRAIANIVGVGHPFVSKVRKSLNTSTGIENHPKRLCIDGKERSIVKNPSSTKINLNKDNEENSEKVSTNYIQENIFNGIDNKVLNKLEMEKTSDLIYKLKSTLKIYSALKLTFNLSLEESISFKNNINSLLDLFPIIIHLLDNYIYELSQQGKAQMNLSLLNEDAISFEDLLILIKDNNQFKNIFKENIEKEKGLLNSTNQPQDFLGIYIKVIKDLAYKHFHKFLFDNLNCKNVKEILDIIDIEDIEFDNYYIENKGRD